MPLNRHLYEVAARGLKADPQCTSGLCRTRSQINCIALYIQDLRERKCHTFLDTTKTVGDSR
jgi:hypothetical protein